ncbi:MAG: hypothetical protein AAGF12_12200 [Myxococcota bacterium]
MPPRTLTFGREASFVVLTHSEDAPSDPEWREYVQFLCSQPMGGVIVFAGRSPPDARQRRQLTEGIRAAGLDPSRPVAVVSRSRVDRSIITALSWFAGNYKAVAPNDVENAFAHVGALGVDRSAVARCAVQCRAQLFYLDVETTNLSFERAAGLLRLPLGEFGEVIRHPSVS